LLLASLLCWPFPFLLDFFYCLFCWPFSCLSSVLLFFDVGNVFLFGRLCAFCLGAFHVYICYSLHCVRCGKKLICKW
jgi:hypothetical protein